MQHEYLRAVRTIATYEAYPHEGWSTRFIMSRRMYFVEYWKAEGNKQLVQRWRELGKRRYLEEAEVDQIKLHIQEGSLVRENIKYVIYS
jgi:trimethylamine:corrinoid methyltransferase-like protein